MSANTETDPRSLRLNIPRLWERDWMAAINDTSGADRFLLNVEGRAAHLLKFISDPSVTFERLAWVSLWTKAFSILEGARAAVIQESQYLLELLSRTSFELVLQMLTVVESEPEERLRAYAAWCLWNDRYFQREFVDPETLKGIWNPQPAEGIANDSNARQVFEQLFGPLEAETDHKELHKGRFYQFKEERCRLDRIESWLGHADLDSWRAKLVNLTGGNENRQVSFFALFNETDKTVAQRLKSLEMRFLYLGYVKGSMFVHGSTLEHMFLLHDGALTPFFTGHAESVSADAELIGSTCNTVLVLLKSVQSKLWS